MTQRRAEPFVDTVARIASRRPRPIAAPPGRHGDVWGDPAQVPYSLIEDDLAPNLALGLASKGARVVYDACGCGGSQCQLDWFSDDTVRDLVRSGVGPDKHPSKDGRADIEHWRSAAGQDLIVLSVDVSWGDAIRS